MKRYLRVMSLVLIVIIVLSGCTTIRGGGWLPHTGELIEFEDQISVELERPMEPTEVSNQKSTFGFTCKVYNTIFDDYDEYAIYGEPFPLDPPAPLTYDAKGHITYIDHEKDIKIEGEILYAMETNDLSYSSGGFVAQGTLNGRECTIYVMGYDMGEPSTGDSLYIEAWGYDFIYYNMGMLGGGNIQTQMPKEAK